MATVYGITLSVDTGHLHCPSQLNLTIGTMCGQWTHPVSSGQSGPSR